VGINWVKVLLAAVTGWFWWYCGKLSTNLLVGVAMFEIYHAVQYNAIVWIYNRRLVDRAGGRVGPLGFLFRDRWSMLGLYLAAIAAYSSLRYLTARPDDRMFSGDLANAHQWLIAVFVASSLLHFYYDGFIWKVSERKTRENLMDEPAGAPALERLVPAFVHAGKWGALAAIAAMLVMAERQYQGGEGKTAKRQADERAALAALTPDVPEARMLASQQALARGDADAAAAFAQQAAKLRPESPRHQAEAAWALIEAGQYAEALPLIEQAIEHDPSNWQYRCDLGDVFDRLGKLDSAQAEYRRATDLAPDELEPWERLASALLRTNQNDAAIKALERAIALGSELAETTYGLGLAHLRLGDAERAVLPLRRAVKIDPRHFQAHVQLGDALIALAKPQAAAEAYRRALALRPNVVDVRVALAEALLKSGRADEAVTLLRDGLASQPDSADLCFTLGRLLILTGQRDEGAKLLQRAKELGLAVE
jgi:Flp pilus assembly protein TadD